MTRPQCSAPTSASRRRHAEMRRQPYELPRPGAASVRAIASRRSRRAPKRTGRHLRRLWPSRSEAPGRPLLRLSVVRGAPQEGGGVRDRLLTTVEVAELLGFAAGTIVDWAERGTIPAFKLGGRLRFDEEEIL